MLGLGLLLAMTIKPGYVSTAVISVTDTPAISAKGKAPRADPAAAAGKDVALLKSERLAINVLQSLRGDNGEKSANSDGSVTSVSGKAVSKFLKKLKISQSANSPVIAISYKSSDPQRAAMIVNRVVDEFRKLKGELLAAQMAEEKDFVDTELSIRRKELLEADKKVEEYKQAHGLSDKIGLEMRVRQIGTLKTQLLLAKLDQQKAESRWRQINGLVKSGNMSALGVAVDSPLVRKFREKEVDLKNRIRELQNEYGPRHPVLIDARSQLEELRDSIRKELLYVSQNIKQDVSIEKQRAAALQQNIDKLEAEVAVGQGSQVRLREMERDADSIKRIYEELLQKTKAMDVNSKDLVLSRIVTVISRGYKPAEAVFPKPSQIMVLTLVGAALLGLLAAFVAEYFNPRVSPAYDRSGKTIPVEKYLQTPAAAALGASSTANTASSANAANESSEQVRYIQQPQSPEKSMESAIPIPGDGSGIVPASELLMKQKSKFAVAINEFNERLLSRLDSKRTNVVLITGKHGVGDKVSVAAAVAVLNASRGRKVMLVDYTRGEAEVHRAFGMQPAPGIAEVTKKSIPLLKAFQTDFRTHVSLFARGEFVDNEVSMTMLSAAPALFTLLKKYFDLVIVVTRDLDVATGAELFSDNVDQAIVVVGRQFVDAGALADISSDSRLEKLGNRLLPVVIER
ncbi:MAG TPA: hypothetical protein ENJ35_10405 [Gammaproteobacteria bacterium]|nr:hypothetical protein [Gammaproteobacteria bacterium]